MFGPMLFASPWVLLALVLLPVIWWLLRLIPPRPQLQDFPPTRLLAELTKKEDTPHASPWWLTLLRLALAAIAIFAVAGPLWSPNSTSGNSDNPLVLVVDNGWTSSEDWQERADTAKGILETASRNGRPVALVITTEPDNAEVRLDDAQIALEKLSAQSALPFPELRGIAADRILRAKDNLGEADVIWLASPLASENDTALAEALNGFESITIRHDAASRQTITQAINGAATLDVTVKRLGAETGPITLRALDENNVSLADVPVLFEDDSLSGLGEIELPIELRNEIVRLSLINNNGTPIANAGAVHLIDDRTRRRTVGLLTGSSTDKDQPLLSPLYYINRALAPFADLREATTPNLAEAIPSLLQSGVSLMVMADVGTLPDRETDRLRKFMTKGGTVVRFAGPRLAATKDTLTPVRLREGERNLGGSLTWEEPQKLARFSLNSPFAGMDLPDDIEVTRQVLAEPDFDLLEKTWAELADGTPLVTAERIGDGWLVLFHVTADATWSNLPISGAFVDMLVKLVAFSSVPASAVQNGDTDAAQVFPPFQTLAADGRLGSPLETAEPIALNEIDVVTPTSKTPPGFYGKAESLIAFNLMGQDTSFEALKPAELLPDATITEISGDIATDLRPIFFTLVMILLLVDAAVVAAMAGLFNRNVTKRMRMTAASAFVIITASTLVLSTDTAHAQDGDGENGVPFDVTLTTRLAYVITGEAEVDEISRAGLFGLTNYISLRTALEPGPPIGLDLSKDELTFFPLIYWPVTETAATPDAATMARVDAFMKQGGTVIFDTRDQIERGIGANTAANGKLREIVASLDVPPLEPVPANHVLTRAFYLLQDFPGRWIGSPLWVEAIDDQNKGNEGTRSQADGVSSILITANDFAGAWATDDNANPLLPTSPDDPQQRIYAFRTGVNIVMYTLTGNYKADQVHIPALLERLGQ